MKTIKKSAMLAASGLAFALAACGEPEVEEVDEVAVVEPEADPFEEFDPASRDYTLSEEAQMRRDEFDEEDFQTEYEGYRDEIVEETGDDMAMASDDGMTTMDGETNTMTSDGDMEGGDMAMTGMRDPDTNMMERSAMSWDYLDRDDDGQLSAAEYAIWAVPLDPTEPLPDDQTAPYLTADQINTAADSFFYYDTDGDTHLSESEFEVARMGGDPAMI